MLKIGGRAAQGKIFDSGERNNGPQPQGCQEEGCGRISPRAHSGRIVHGGQMRASVHYIY